MNPNGLIAIQKARLAASAVLKSLAPLFDSQGGPEPDLTRSNSSSAGRFNTLFSFGHAVDTALVAAERAVAWCREQDTAFTRGLWSLRNVLSEIKSATSGGDNLDLISGKAFHLAPLHEKLQGAIRKLRDLEERALQPPSRKIAEQDRAIEAPIEERDPGGEGKPAAVGTTQGEAGALEDYVTLNQMAGVVQRSKRTLEGWYRGKELPPPDVKGGRGRPHEWRWKIVRPKLEQLSKRQLPERFPGSRLTS